MEHDSYRDGPCLCGQGQVTRHVSSTDYPFGAAEVTYSLDCKNCTREWRLEFGTLVEIRSSSAAKIAYGDWLKLAEATAELRSKIVNSHISFLDLRTKKAEMEELARLKLYQHNYRQYIKRRRLGETPGQIAHETSHDRSGLISIAGDQRGMLIASLDDADGAMRAWKSAAKRIVRRARPD